MTSGVGKNMYGVNSFVQFRIESVMLDFYPDLEALVVVPFLIMVF